MSRFALEKYKFFPILAWVVLLSFSFFVYTIVVDLKKSTSELSDATNRLEKLLSQPLDANTDFSS